MLSRLWLLLNLFIDVLVNLDRSLTGQTHLAFCQIVVTHFLIHLDASRADLPQLYYAEIAESICF